MNDDVKALAGKMRQAARYLEEIECHTVVEWGNDLSVSTDELVQAADALEASVREVAALTAEADRAIDQANNLAGDLEVSERALAFERLRQADEALEASVQGPAVDREALANEIARWFPVTLQDPDEWAIDRARLVVKSLFASGLLRDVRDVQAEALEDAASACDDDWGEFGYYGPDGLITYGTVPEILRDRAQAIREARNG